MVCITHRAACICGLGRSAVLQILAVAPATTAVCGLAAHPDPQRTLSARVMQTILNVMQNIPHA